MFELKILLLHIELLLGESVGLKREKRQVSRRISKKEK
jgi:hypothetical protein